MKASSMVKPHSALTSAPNTSSDTTITMRAESDESDITDIPSLRSVSARSRSTTVRLVEAPGGGQPVVPGHGGGAAPLEPVARLSLYSSSLDNSGTCKTLAGDST